MSLLRVAVLIALAGGSANTLLAAASGIRHAPPSCMDTETFPLVEARVEADERPRHVLVHFRAESDTGWYTVELVPTTATVFQAALPKPLPEAVRVVYFIESDRPSLRSPEYTVEVLMGGCPGARSAPEELTDDIRVRRTSSQQDAVPEGFATEGLRSAGRPSRTTLGILAGAAGGAGIAALVATGDEVVAPPPPAGSPGAIRACFTPDPIPDIESGDTIRFDASCTTPDTVTTFQWSFGDGATALGSSVEHLFEPGGVYTVSLTVSDGARTDNKSRLVQVRATPTACFITSPDPPRITTNESVNFNADCSVGDRDGGPAQITSYVWDFGDGRPSAEGRFVSRQFPRPDLYGVSLTVTNEDGRQDTTTQFVVVERPGTGTGRTEIAFTSELELDPGTRARVSINEAVTLAATAGARELLRTAARTGENLVDGQLVATAGERGRWTFDFGAVPGFVAGSLRVERGQAISVEAARVVFDVDAEGGATVRFRFRVE